jgi:hypothetical protein
MPNSAEFRLRTRLNLNPTQLRDSAVLISITSFCTVCIGILNPAGIASAGERNIVLRTWLVYVVGRSLIQLRCYSLGSVCVCVCVCVEGVCMCMYAVRI